MLADVFNNFEVTCLHIYELNPTKFFSAPVLSWQAVFKKTKVKLNLLANTDMLMIVEKKTLEVENVMLFFDMQNPTKNT